jgi:hypothetical protein
MSRFLRFSAVCTALVVIPMAVNSQQPPDGGSGGRSGRGFGGGGGADGGGGRSGFGGRGMMGGDPMQFFDMIAKGKDVIRRDDLDPNFQRMFDRMAQSEGITNGPAISSAPPPRISATGCAEAGKVDPAARRRR